jgi:hypothetical protein
MIAQLVARLVYTVRVDVANRFQPQELPIEVLATNQGNAQAVDNAALGHGVQEGHRHHDEQKQFGIGGQISLKRRSDVFGRTLTNPIANKDGKPDQAAT